MLVHAICIQIYVFSLDTVGFDFLSHHGDYRVSIPRPTADLEFHSKLHVCVIQFTFITSRFYKLQVLQNLKFIFLLKTVVLTFFFLWTL